MLRVRLEMVTGGDERRALEIGRIDISNVSELAELSNYQYRMREGDEHGNAWQVGYVLSHARSKGAWELVRRVLVGHTNREPTIAHQEAAPEAPKE
jgi:hypothetical protein